MSTSNAAGPHIQTCDPAPDLTALILAWEAIQARRKALEDAHKAGEAFFDALLAVAGEKPLRDLVRGDCLHIEALLGAEAEQAHEATNELGRTLFASGPVVVGGETFRGQRLYAEDTGEFFLVYREVVDFVPPVAGHAAVCITEDDGSPD